MSKTLYISVVSHNQQDLIKQNFSSFVKQIDQFKIKLAILDNTGSKELKEFCKKEQIVYFYDGKQRGFGANHNRVFSLLSPKDEDLFLVCNPDIIVEPMQLRGMLNIFENENHEIYTPTIYLDKNKTIKDNPDKNFPGLLNFAISVATGKRLHYGTRINTKNPSWISGAFMLFRAKIFRELNGFDEDYFMYCEDLDICYRAKKNHKVIFNDNRFYVIHNAQMQSRRLLSKNMLWHSISAIKFLTKNQHYKLLNHTIKLRKSQNQHIHKIPRRDIENIQY